MLIVVCHAKFYYEEISFTDIILSIALWASSSGEFASDRLKRSVQVPHVRREEGDSCEANTQTRV